MRFLKFLETILLTTITPGESSPAGSDEPNRHKAVANTHPNRDEGKEMVARGKSDDELVGQWQEGRNRDEAFECLFVRYRTPIARFFRKRGFPDEECRDLTQRTFLRVYQGMAGFQRSSSFKTWLFKIARNLWKNALRDRQAKKRDGDEVSLDAMVEAEDEVAYEVERSLAANAGSRGPLARILVAEQQRQLKEALTELPRDQQRLVLCRIDQDLKYREIADMMKMPIGTVKSQLAKARRQLKEQLDDVYTDIELMDG